MNAPTDCTVPRDAVSLAAAMKEMLHYGSRILFVDPFYDPFNSRYKSTFRECLNLVKVLNLKASCEIHHRHHDSDPTAADFEREAMYLFPSVIPDGIFGKANGAADCGQIPRELG
jgi:hypothetical protein